MNLECIGWSAAWHEGFSIHASVGLVPARIAGEHRGAYDAMTEAGPVAAEVSGRFRHEAQSRADYPAVGDWVALDMPAGAPRAVIHAILPRATVLSRRAAGTKVAEQPVAANVDVLFLVSALGADLNYRRIERYLTLARESGAAPVILLNKADCHADAEAARQAVQALAGDVPVVLTSAVSNEGLHGLRECLGQGMTGALVGSSGVGKSSIVNALLGVPLLATAAVREKDERGRHTTTRRELIPIPGGGVLIDTPGMRELSLWADESALEGAFDEISALAAECRFRDCSHVGEPGCAVQRALAEGVLDMGRYEGYLRQRREIRHHMAESNVHVRLAERKRWKAIHKANRHNTKRTGVE
mgnify:CR=1 FL=1